MPNPQSMASGDLLITLSRVGSFRAGRHGDLMRKLLTFLIAAIFSISVSASSFGSMMLLGVGGGSAGTPFSITYVSDNSFVGSSPVTFTSQAIGTADPTRIVVVTIGTITSGGGLVTSVTIGGSTANHATGASTNNGTGGSGTDIYYLAVPSGTTATIVVTGTSFSRCVIGVYSVVGTGSAFSTANAANNAAITSLPVTVTVPAGGGAIGVLTPHSSSAGPLTITNMTMDINNLVVGGSTYGFGNTTSAPGSTTFTGNWAGSTDAAISVATFSP
jgi:hypothetical protein